MNSNILYNEICHSTVTWSSKETFTQFFCVKVKLLNDVEPLNFEHEKNPFSAKSESPSENNRIGQSSDRLISCVDCCQQQ